MPMSAWLSGIVALISMMANQREIFSILSFYNFLFDVFLYLQNSLII